MEKFNSVTTPGWNVVEYLLTSFQQIVITIHQSQKYHESKGRDEIRGHGVLEFRLSVSIS